MKGKLLQRQYISSFIKKKKAKKKSKLLTKYTFLIRQKTSKLKLLKFTITNWKYKSF